ncbi:MAG: hypothetical protein FWH00_02895, partial [Oscillospiraceae bacterium]|nr:hypothetical protein [Oscillospiraceae bacterium]
CVCGVMRLSVCAGVAAALLACAIRAGGICICADMRLSICAGVAAALLACAIRAGGICICADMRLSVCAGIAAALRCGKAFTAPASNAGYAWYIINLGDGKSLPAPRTAVGFSAGARENRRTGIEGASPPAAISARHRFRIT